MNEEQSYIKLQEMLNIADEIVGEHYGAVEIIKELMEHLDIDAEELLMTIQ